MIQLLEGVVKTIVFVSNIGSEGGCEPRDELVFYPLD